MKKTIFSFLLLGSSAWVMAQSQPTTPPTTTPTNRINPNNPANSTPTNNNVNPNTLSNTNQSNTNLMNNGNNSTPVQSSTLNNPQSMQSPERTTNTVVSPLPENTNSINNTNTNTNTNLNNNTTTGSVTDPTIMNSSPSTTTSAYVVNVPTTIQGTFTTAYPSATDVSWTQSGDWYRARYRENGQVMQVSYREDGKTMTIPASPILRTYVPEEVVSKAIDVYGMNVYAIAKSRGQNGEDLYNVTVIENGQSKTVWMNADGSSVANAYRTSDDQVASNVQMNTRQQNTEVTTSAVVSDESTTTGTINTTSTNSATATPERTNTEAPNDRVESSDQNSTTETNNNTNNEALNNASNDTRVRREAGDDNVDTDVEPSVAPL